MRIKPFKAVFPDNDKIGDILNYTETVRDNFPEMNQKHFLKSGDTMQLILYSITSETINATGIICLTDIRDYKEGSILKHEKTLEEKEIQQANLISERNSMVKPVLLTYPVFDHFSEYLETLKVDHNLIQQFYFEDKKENHRFWAINGEKEIQYIINFFGHDLMKVYVADGHHRLATFARLSDQDSSGKFDHILTVYFPFNSLRIHPFHRIISIDDNFQETEFLSAISEICFFEKIETFCEPRFKYNFILHTGVSIYSCVWKPSLIHKYRVEPLLLDSALLNAVLFREIFHVKDARTDERINYVEGHKGWEGFVKAFKKDKHKIGFFLYPVDFEDFQKVSDLHLTLPPKSTWFEPRIRNGLVIHEFSNE